MPLWIDSAGVLDQHGRLSVRWPVHPVAMCRLSLKSALPLNIILLPDGIRHHLSLVRIPAVFGVARCRVGGGLRP